MKKVIVGLITLILLSSGGLFFYFKNTDQEPLRCKSLVVSEISLKDHDKITLNLELNFFTVKNGSSELLTSGTIKTPSGNYIVARRIFFSSRPSDFKEFKKVKMIREERHYQDNVPDELWQDILPETPEAEFYAGIKHLSPHAILIQKLSNPYFICAIIDN